MISKTLVALFISVGLCPAQEPDNSNRNKRDRSDTTMTADKQSSDKNELDLVRMIRRELTRSDMSTYAKNVKVITQTGRVILRGPVNTQQEKTAIELIAKKHAGERTVDNQLEIKPGKQ